MDLESWRKIIIQAKINQGSLISTGIIFAIGTGIGMFLLLLVFATIFATKSLKDRKAKKMREYFFKQNRGLLLQQLVDKDIAERMIFSLEELEKATNKFDKARVLGGGGHGTVYKRQTLGPTCCCY